MGLVYRKRRVWGLLYTHAPSDFAAAWCIMIRWLPLNSARDYIWNINLLQNRTPKLRRPKIDNLKTLRRNCINGAGSFWCEVIIVFVLIFYAFMKGCLNALHRWTLCETVKTKVKHDVEKDVKSPRLLRTRCTPNASAVCACFHFYL